MLEVRTNTTSDGDNDIPGDILSLLVAMLGCSF